MPGGLAIAAASSAAWSEMGAQAERALNTGWIFDQRPDGAGGFISNDSPTSSGLTFQSTGNATAFYPIGRALQVIQAAGTAICTVGQSSFSGGITNVFLNQFSTQAGLLTALSTGTITSVAASPFFPLSTQNNTFGGAVVAAATGGNPGIAVGANPALSGTYRLPNAGSITSRSAAGADQDLLKLSANDNVLVGQGGGLMIYLNNTAGVGFGTTSATIGTSGFIRLPNSAVAIVGKTSTGGDDVIWPAQFSSTTLTAQIFSSGANGTNIFSKSLAVGTWWISAGLTVQDTGSANVGAAIAINNGTTDLFTQQTAFNQIIGTTGPSGSLSINGIVSHTTALTYNIVLFGPTTTLKAVPAGGGWSGFGGSTAASWFNAVKIG